MTSPYSDLPDHRFWRRAVSAIEPHALDPVVETKFKIERFERIATAGSCFAQHISKALAASGCHYYVPEHGRPLDHADLDRLGYGMFSARYGNIYTSRQLLQLFQEAFGLRPKSEAAWRRPDGRYVDPFRPRIDPGGFGRADAVQDARAEHLNFVREVFLNADVFLFTLGLTETWISSASDDVFPLAPGVAGGAFDPKQHRFVNLPVEEVVGDLEAFLTGLKRINPRVRVILTVSPVPLIATYEARHVLVSTAYSKSVLRVAAEQASAPRDWVDYFPSYELITGNYHMGAYYEEDLREVNALGVAHALRCFLAHYMQGRSSAEAKPVFASSAPGQQAPREVICDEEALESASA